MASRGGKASGPGKETRAMPDATLAFRAPMRARDRDVAGGAAFALAHRLVGTGDALASAPAGIGEAIAAAAAQHGEKAGRMLHRFAAVPTGAFVWTRTEDDAYHLGRITGPWRYDDSPAARAVGIHHVRPAIWLDDPLADAEIPAAVARTFARGGRNFQRIHDREAERRTADLWALARPR